MRRIIGSMLVLAVLAGLLGATRAEAAVQYWDTNGSAAGSGNAGGDWSLTLWTADPTGASATGAWVPGSDAVFAAGTDALGTWTATNPTASLSIGNLTVAGPNVTLGGAGSFSLVGSQTWAVYSGSLTTAQAVSTGGTLTLNILGGASMTVGSVTGNIVRNSPGTLTITGQVSGTSTFNSGGGTTILNNASGNALVGNVTISNGIAQDAIVQLGANDQIADTASITFGGGNYAYFKMMGYSETVGAITGGTNAVIQNTQNDSGVTGNSILTTDNSGSATTYSGYIRDRAGGTSTGTMGLTKKGSAGLTLSGGANVIYTGPTSVQGGTLTLDNIYNFQSVITNDAALVLNVSSGQYNTYKGIRGSTGTGTVTKTGVGWIWIAGTSSYTGDTTISAGMLRADDGVGLPSGAGTGKLTINGSIWEMGRSTTRALGTGAGQVQITGGNAGFSAYSGAVTMNLQTGVAGIAWGAGAFTPTNLTLNETTAQGTLTLQDDIDLNNTVSTVTRTINVNTAAPGATATLSGALSNSGAGATTLAKGGVGTLILSNTTSPFTGTLTINAGTLGVYSLGDGGAGAIGSGTINVGAGTVGAGLQFLGATAQSTTRTINMAGSSGGATIDASGSVAAATLTLAGTWTSGAGAKTLTLQGSNTGANFVSGVIIDNAPANKTSLVKDGAGLWVLTGANSFTGSATVKGGTLKLGDVGGALASTAIAVNPGATLTLDNLSTANSGTRIADTAVLTMNGGTLNFSNNAGAVDYAETIGQLSIAAGASTVTAGQAAASQMSTLTFGTGAAAGLVRTAGATVNFTGTGLGLDGRNTVVFNTAPALDDGIIGGWAISGNEFAKYVTGAVTSVTPLVAGDYNTGDQAAWLSTLNIKRATSPAAMMADRQVNSLNLAQTAAVNVATGGFILRIESGGLLISGSFAAQISGTGKLTAGTGSGTAGELVVNQNSGTDATISAVIANNGAGVVGLTRGGTGLGNVTITGANTYSGATNINFGKMKISNASSLGTTSGVTVASGAVLELAPSGNTTFTAWPITLNGTGVTNAGALRNISKDNKWQGAVTLGSDARINSDANTLTLDVASGNAITGTNTNLTFGGSGTVAVADPISLGSGGITKDGAGAAELQKANTYTGPTIVNNGTLRVRDPGALGTSSAIVVNSGGTIELQRNVSNQSINMSKPLILNGGTLQHNGGGNDNTWSGQVSLGSNSRINSNGNTLNVTAAQAIVGPGWNLTIGGSANTTVSGAIILGAGSLTKDGTGTAILGMLNDYTGGTFVTAGYLQFNRPDALGGTTARDVTIGVNGALRAGYAGLLQPILNDRIVTTSAGSIIAYGTNNEDLDFATPGLNLFYGVNGGNYTGTITPNASTYRLSTAANWYLPNQNALTGATNVVVGDTGTSTVYILNTNDYTGTTTLQKGALAVSSLGAGGADSGIGKSTSAASNLILSGGTLQYVGGANAVTDRNYSFMNADSTFRVDGFGNLEISGDMTAQQTSNKTLYVRGAGPGVGTLSGKVVDNGTLKTVLRKEDAGTWIITNTDNAFTGGIVANGGVIQFNSAGALGAGTTRDINIGTGGAVALNFASIQSTLTGRVLNTSGGTVALVSDSSENLDFSSAGANFTAGFLGASKAVNYTGILTPNGTTYRLGGGGGTLTMSNSSAITGTGNALTIGGGGGGGVVVLAASNDYTGVTTINSGVTLSVSDPGQLGTGNYTLSGGTLRITGSSFVSPKAVALSAASYIEAAGSGTLSGAITGSNALNIIGSSTGTLTLSGGATNAYTGDTNIYSGTLKLGANESLPSGSGKGNVRVQGTLDLAGFTQTINALNGNGTIDNTAAGTATLTVGGNNGGGQFAGVIQNTGGALGLTKIGTGTTTLQTVSDTFTGALAIQNGVLAVYSLADSGTGSNGTGMIKLGDTATIGQLRYLNGPTTTSRVIDLAGTTFGGTIDNSGTGPITFTGGVTASGVGAKSLTLQGTNAFDNTLGGDLVNSSSGATSLKKTGTGLWVLDGAKNYTGGTIISQGILAVSSDNNLGASGGITFDTNDNILQIRGTAAFASSRTILFNTSGKYGTFDNDNCDVTLSGAMSGAGKFRKYGAGTLTINTAVSSTASGGFDVNGGLVVLDFANMVTPTNLVASQGFGVGGGTMKLVGKASATTSQNFGSGIYINMGDSAVIVDTSNGCPSATLSLNAQSARNAGGTIDFSLLGSNSKITTTKGPTNSILGGYATFGGNTWAVPSGATPFTIIGLADASYSTVVPIATNANFDVPAGTTNVAASVTANTLRFNTSTASAITIDPAATLTIGGNGILVTSAVGADASITGGKLTGPSSSDLVLIQNNTTNALTIGSAIVNTGTTALTKSGPGKVILTGANTYTGTTYVNNGTLAVTGAGVAGNTFSDFNIGNAADLSPVATVTIDDPAAVILANTYLRVGYNGYGVITQSAGTVTSNQWAFVGDAYGAYGKYDMSGGTLNVSVAGTGTQHFAVGNNTEGVLNLSGDAEVNVYNNAWMIVARQKGSTGEVNQGGDSVVNVLGTGNLAVGWNGTGTYTQTGNSQVNVLGGQVILGSTGVGTYYLNGGTLNTSGIGSGFAGMFASGSSLHFGGGTFKASGSASVTAPIVVDPIGGTVDTNGNNVRLTQPVTGTGALTKANSGGALVLVGSNTFGGLFINGGKVIASGSTSLGSGKVTVGLGAILSLDDTQPGLLGEYYNNPWASYDFNNLANVNAHFAGKTPVVVAASTDRGKANFDFAGDGTGFPLPFSCDPAQLTASALQFEGRWTGQFNAPTSGVYTFASSSDDGSMLFVDGQTATNRLIGGSIGTTTGTPIYLTAGLHDVVFTFTQGTGNYGFYVDVALPGQAPQRLTNAMLQYSVGSDATITALAGLGSVTLGSHMLTIDGGGGENFSGSISGSGAVVKTGAGRQIFSGANLYTGRTAIMQGILEIQGAGSIATSPLIELHSGATLDVSGATPSLWTLAAGQTLTGSGTVSGDMAVGNGATLSPGDSPGTLTHSPGDETWAGGGTYLWEVNTVDNSAVQQPGTLQGKDPGFDFVNIAGALNITATSGQKFVIDITGLDPATGQEGNVANWNEDGEYSWVIATAAGGITGFDPDTFELRTTKLESHNGLGENSKFVLRQNGNDVVLYVPEPATLALLAFGSLGVLLSRKRK